MKTQFNKKKNKIRSTIEQYIEIITNIEERMDARNMVLEKHFKILDSKSALLAESPAKPAVQLERSISLPNIFLASSLGFNKLNWTKNVESILSHYNLGKKLVIPTLRSAILFEKLKIIMVKLQEKERKKR